MNTMLQDIYEIPPKYNIAKESQISGFIPGARG